MCYQNINIDKYIETDKYSDYQFLDNIIEDKDMCIAFDKNRFDLVKYKDDGKDIIITGNFI